MCNFEMKRLCCYVNFFGFPVNSLNSFLWFSNKNMTYLKCGCPFTDVNGSKKLQPLGTSVKETTVWRLPWTKWVLSTTLISCTIFKDSLNSSVSTSLMVCFCLTKTNCFFITSVVFIWNTNNNKQLIVANNIIIQL